MSCDPQVPGDWQHQARGAGGQQAQAGHPGDRGQDRGIQAREPRGVQLGNQGPVSAAHNLCKQVELNVKP